MDEQNTPTCNAITRGMGLNNTPAPAKPPWGKFIVVCLLISSIMSATSVYIYHRHFAREILAVNITKYMAKQREAILAGKITEEQAKKNLASVVYKIKALPSKYAIISDEVAIGNILVYDLIQNEPQSDQPDTKPKLKEKLKRKEPIQIRRYPLAQ